LKVIETGSNLGFAAGNNVGMRVATGRYHALINSDMVLKPGCVQEMVAFMDRTLVGEGTFTGAGLDFLRLADTADEVVRIAREAPAVSR